MKTKPWLTAIHRKTYSAPVKTLLDKELLNPNHKILDYGCGYGLDVDLLSADNYNITGYDKYIEPFTNTDTLQSSYDTVTCMYVLNTIEDIEERIEVLSSIIKLLNPSGQAFIAVRSIDEFKKSKSTKYTEYNDGIITSKNTFQKYFSIEDLENLILNNFNNISIEYIKFPKNSLFIKIQKEVA